MAEVGVEAEVVDLRSLTPIDGDTLSTSVGKTGHLISADTAQCDFGATAEVTSLVVEQSFADLKRAPLRIGLPQVPTPTTPSLADHFYPDAREIARSALDLLESPRQLPPEAPDPRPWKDVPDATFTGPY